MSMEQVVTEMFHWTVHFPSRYPGFGGATRRVFHCTYLTQCSTCKAHEDSQVHGQMFHTTTSEAHLRPEVSGVVSKTRRKKGRADP